MTRAGLCCVPLRGIREERAKEQGRGEDLSQTYRGKCWHTAGGGGFPSAQGIPSWSRALVCRASRQDNFSSLSLWILQVHSPELLSLSLPLGRDCSWCFGFIFFSLSDFQLFLPEGCSFPGTLLLSAHKWCARAAESSCRSPGSLPGLSCCCSPLSSGAAGLFAAAAAAFSLPPALGAAFARVSLLMGRC